MITVISVLPCPNYTSHAPRPVSSPVVPVIPDCDDAVIEHLRRCGGAEVSRWDIVNAIEPDLGVSRAALRKRRSSVLKRLDDLVRVGAVEKIGRYRVRLAQETVVASAKGSAMPCSATFTNL